MAFILQKNMQSLNGFQPVDDDGSDEVYLSPEEVDELIRELDGRELPDVLADYREIVRKREEQLSEGE